MKKLFSTREFLLLLLNSCFNLLVFFGKIIFYRLLLLSVLFFSTFTYSCGHLHNHNQRPEKNTWKTINKTLKIISVFLSPLLNPDTPNCVCFARMSAHLHIPHIIFVCRKICSEPPQDKKITHRSLVDGIPFISVLSAKKYNIILITKIEKLY